MTVTAQVSRPPLGRNQWPLTDNQDRDSTRLEADLHEGDRANTACSFDFAVHRRGAKLSRQLRHPTDHSKPPLEDARALPHNPDEGASLKVLRILGDQQRLPPPLVVRRIAVGGFPVIGSHAPALSRLQGAGLTLAPQGVAGARRPSSLTFGSFSGTVRRSHGGCAPGGKLD